MPLPQTTETTLIDKLKALAEVIKADGRYTQIHRTQDADGDYEVHEYQSPLGKGYQIFIYKEDVDGKYFMSVGYGPESVSRTWNWQEITDDVNV